MAISNEEFDKHWELALKENETLDKEIERVQNEILEIENRIKNR